MPPSNTLDRFHPIVSDWFTNKFGRPTEIQELAWELIAQDENALISAATGSGKTLAAFLWALNQLINGKWELGLTRVVYISPLKALNNDIQRNVLSPLKELQQLFAEKGEGWPDIRVQTRSGDTSQSDRKKMLRNPPEILIVTPESLNLMLTNKDGQRSLLGVKSLILDEIHSVVGSKRGVYLMSGVERLANLAGEFQRVALSATVRPMDKVARFVGGFRWDADKLVSREVKLAQSSSVKEYAIQVRFPDEANEDADEDDFWHPIIMDIKEIVAKNQSTLIFVNSRRLCESITYKINRNEPIPIAYSHHGSLSKDIRAAVEQRMKSGELKAIVATNSLEMGIDIGALDCVIMVQCPGLVSSAIQKVGRAGHQVGAVSKASLFPSHSRDFLEAAVLSKAIKERAIEPVRPIECPLDVLAQIIVSTLGVGSMEIDTLYKELICSFSYRNLNRDHFDLVLEMLAGRYASSRLRELKPRVAINRSENTVTLRKGALLTFYFSGGVIVDRGYFHLRLEESGARIGELDEEFVWERSIGDVFTLGTQSWKVTKITYNDVFVVPSKAQGPMPPFWRAEEFNRDFYYSERIGDFLEWANDCVVEDDFEEILQDDHDFDGTTAKALKSFLGSQKKVCRDGLPHRHRILAEKINAGPTGAPGKQLVLHTHWGGRVNRPYALALDTAWEERFGLRTEIYVNNDCVVVTIPEEADIDEICSLVRASNVEILLRKRLDASGFFGARFRESAGLALLITRQKAGQRLPLWMSRLRAKKLLESVQSYEDFPILLEAWRTCLRDEFDMDSLQKVLLEFESGEMELSKIYSEVASPFAKSVAWRQINDKYMYANDDPLGTKQSNLREDLIRSVSQDSRLRPAILEEVILDFEKRRQRLIDGYAPSDALELKEWLRDRIAIPLEEWGMLLSECSSWLDGETALPFEVEVIDSKLIVLSEELEKAKKLQGKGCDASVLLEWLSFYGPKSQEEICGLFGISKDQLDLTTQSWLEEGVVVSGEIVQGDSSFFICESENFQILLRMQRLRNRPEFSALPLSQLVPFLAQRQGLLRRDADESHILDTLENLSGFFASANSWEESILASRIPNYRSSWLDSGLLEESILWIGTEKEKVGFAYEDELDLVLERGSVSLSENALELLEKIDGSEGGSYSFSSLSTQTGMSPGRLEKALWELIWSGKIGNDTFAALRRGILNKFGGNREESLAAVKPVKGRRMRGMRSGLSKAPVYPGHWFALPNSEDENDPIFELEESKARVRLLLERYGVLFKELLQRESSLFQWRNVFKALRIMELSGEIVSGQFFQGVPGLQFASNEAVRSLRKGTNSKGIYWMVANDPASLCGLGVEALKGNLPRRVASTLLSYRGDELALEIHKNGKELVFHISPDDEDIVQILEPLRHLLGRSFQARNRIELETINGENAATSIFLNVFEANFRIHMTHKGLVLEK
ncbi:DEAD/DEAH box helicase [Puniceicoccaceae bacterium K14]|nr:DEAD/DEAH box helicase [Puniceicoccaceae bacterium K14]